MRKLVIERAGERCEYCGLSQIGQEAAFHVDHIIPVITGGPTDAENLALACVSRSLRKGAREHVEDLETGKRCRLFHPRQDVWQDHFEWKGLRVEGLTPTGRGTVAALQLNRRLILSIRQEEAHWNRHPPV